MSKSFAVCLAILSTAGLAVAQPAAASEAAPTSATVVQAADMASTSTAPADARSSATAIRDASSSATAGQDAPSSATAASRMFTEEQFNRRWEMEESMYRQAGIADEKIQKLKDLNSQIWKVRASGGKGDFQAIMKQRAEILSQEEVQKIRDLRRSQIEKQLGERRQGTTGTASQNPE